MAKCFNCSKTSEDVKPCAKCHSTTYCSKDCQKAHWKAHKKVCASLAAARSNGGSINFNATTHADVLSTPINKPYHKLKERAWLHDRSETDIMKLLVDTYRFRRLEELHVVKVTDIVDLDPDSTSYMAHFREYIYDAAKKDLLPAQFTQSKIEKCIEYALAKANWSNLHDLWTSEEAFLRHYGTGSFLAQMTLFAWQVEGSVVPFDRYDEESGDAPYEETLERGMRKELGH